MWIDGRAGMSLAMLAIFAGMVLVAWGYPPETRLLPLVIGIPGIALCSLQLVNDLLAARRAARARPTVAPIAKLRREAALLLWFLGFLAAVLAFGFLFATPVMAFLFLYFDQREPLRLSATLAFSGLLVVYGVFEVLLELILFRGLLAEWL